MNLTSSTRNRKIRSALFSLSDYSNEIFDESLSLDSSNDSEPQEIPHDVFQVVKVPIFVEMVSSRTEVFLLNFEVFIIWSIPCSR